MLLQVLLQEHSAGQHMLLLGQWDFFDVVIHSLYKRRVRDDIVGEVL